jgi:hypothetical protein
MNAESMATIRELVGTIDGGLPREPIDQTDQSRRVFEMLGEDGGLVEAIDPPAFQRTRISELGTWTEDPWGSTTYGVDASTTRPIEFTNGLVFDVAHAKTAATGSADRAIERTARVVACAYHDDGESTLRSQTLQDEGAVRSELVCFPPDAEETRNIAKSVASVAQRLSESQQAADTLDAMDDGPLFLDGAVLPLGILYWLLLDHEDNRSPAATWDVPYEIVSNYVEVIDRLHDRDLPVIGIVKSGSMSQVLTALREKIRIHDLKDPNGRTPGVPWMHDHQLMTEVLQHGDTDYLAYTSWFESHGQEVRDTPHHLLTPVEQLLGHGPPEAYRRAFFYVRLPRTGDLLRVEAPYLMVDDEARRRQIQLKALKEIARRRGVPQAISRADRIARITRGNRDAIRAMIRRATPSFDHNRDGRWRHLELTPES